jgi:ectoine hydroxylase-related dioxygenase (phytanoyl-CoA dioxygenase family)
MSYEYEKYACTIDTLRETLDKYGCAIIPNVINIEECEKLNSGIWDFFEHITQNWPISIDRQRKSTWKYIYNLHPLHSQLFQHWNIGHCQISWTMRENENILNIFARLWNCNIDELVSSFDALSLCLPPEVTDKGYHHKTWYHTDQSYLRNDMECIQSWITGNDVDDGDATLGIMEGSHLYHEQFAKKYNINDSADWYKLNSKEERFYLDKGCQYHKIKCPKGSLVLWDSRTIHCGTNPVRGRRKPNIRSIIYLCYMPRSQCSIKQLCLKQQLFYDKRTSNHWPCNPKAFAKDPATYGEPLPIIVEIDDPIVSDLGMKLAGF